MRILDPYTLRAQFQPILLAILPVGLLLFTWLPGDSFPVSGLLGTIGTASAITLLAQMGRDQGSKKQSALWDRWGGAPSTRLLRFRDSPNKYWLERLRVNIENLMGYPLPTEQEEIKDPVEADLKYEAVVTFLRASTRDKSKHPLVFAENVNYGFRRNLWGLKPYGLAIATLAAIGSWVILILSLGHRPPKPG